MQITPSIDAVATAVNQWAASEGWQTVGLDIAAQYHYEGGGSLLPDPDSDQDNARQRVRRIFQNCDGPRYSAMAAELTGPALRAMPVLRSAAVSMPDAPQYLSALALKEITEFLNAVNLGAPDRELCKEGREAREAFNRLFNTVIPSGH